jgi:hypothetical protein
MNGYQAIKCFNGINDVDSEKVQNLVNSILVNGWKGAPILYIEDQGIVTGSHRLAALKTLQALQDEADGESFDRIYDALESAQTLDVTDIVNAWCEENDATFQEFPFDSLGLVFAGTVVEQYAEELEWF